MGENDAYLHGFTMGQVDESQIYGRRFPIPMEKQGYVPLEYYSYIENTTHGLGGSVELDAGIDIYGLSATMCSMLTGMRPPDAYSILSDGFPRLFLLDKGISISLVDILQKGMSPMRGQRYQSMDEFYDILSEELKSSNGRQKGVSLEGKASNTSNEGNIKAESEVKGDSEDNGKSGYFSTTEENNGKSGFTTSLEENNVENNGSRSSNSDNKCKGKGKEG